MNILLRIYSTHFKKVQKRKNSINKTIAKVNCSPQIEVAIATGNWIEKELE